MSEELPPPPPPPKQRINLQEFRNCDLVSRLLAATPPYLYSAPVGPNNFFFSEMLRSLVQAKNNEQCTRNAAAISSHLGRRPRKRSWSQHRSMFEQTKSDEKSINNNNIHEKPLELTNKVSYSISPKYQKSESPKVMSNENILPSSNRISNHHQLDIKPDYSSTPSHSPSTQTSQGTPDAAPPPVPAAQTDLVLPPPPPMWYPPLYPPYGIDPLHFFIDLRVSGHIYDRKKENISPTATVDNNNSTESGAADAIGKHRHGSAFSVPAPRGGGDKSMMAALNLTSDKTTDYSSYFDYNDRPQTGHKNTNYVMQNLPRIFTGNQSSDEKTLSPTSEETDSKSDCEIDIKEHDDEPNDNVGDDVVVVDGGRSDDELMVGT